MNARKLWFLGLAVCLSLVVSACRSHRIEATVENRTGAPIRLLEVDYPTASFGANALAPGEILQYTIALRGSGPLSVLYTAPSGAQVHIGGPTLTEGQGGRLGIVLQPGGKAEFHPTPSPAR